MLGLYREEMYDPGGGMEGATELIVVKNRNGPTDRVKLLFKPKMAKFENITNEELSLL